MSGPAQSSSEPSAAARLEAHIAEELARPGLAAAARVAEELRRRHPGAAAVLFYGSCLRRGSADGVLDFYVLVDDYRAAHGSRWLAALNAALPPNVLYCETPGPEATLRAKYNVMTTADFARTAAGRSADGRVWARFAQPSALVWVRDAETRRDVVEAVAAATLTLVERMPGWLPGDGPELRATPEELWCSAFRETYRAEPRSESAEAVAGLVAADPERYERVLRAALDVLQERGTLAWREESGRLVIACPAGLRSGQRRAWRWARPRAKAIAALGIAKTAATFDDWVPYVLWKLERHSGERIEVSERQRRHPFLFGWPVLFRLLRRGVLR